MHDQGAKSKVRLTSMQPVLTSLHLFYDIYPSKCDIRLNFIVLCSLHCYLWPTDYSHKADGHRYMTSPPLPIPEYWRVDKIVIFSVSITNKYCLLSRHNSHIYSNMKPSLVIIISLYRGCGMICSIKHLGRIFGKVITCWPDCAT